MAKRDGMVQDRKQHLGAEIQNTIEGQHGHMSPQLQLLCSCRTKAFAPCHE